MFRNRLELWYSLSRRGRFIVLQDPNLLTRDAVEAEYDRTVREDIELFRQAATDYTAGALTDDQFRAQRLRRGGFCPGPRRGCKLATKGARGALSRAQSGTPAVGA